MTSTIQQTNNNTSTIRQQSINNNTKQPTKDELDELHEVFKCFDVDGSGTVTISELGLVLKNLNKNFSTDQLKHILSAYDNNNDGVIDFDEFIHMMYKHYDQTQHYDDNELLKAFNVFDRDRDGRISARELEIIIRAIGENIDTDSIQLMIECVDTDKNGQIDFNEFKQLLTDGPTGNI